MNKAVLIYDGECPLCRGSVRLVQSSVRSGELELLPFQAPDRATRYPELTEEACQQGIQLVLPNGCAVAGSEAVLETLARLRGWHWLSHVLRTPGVKLLVGHLYGWIARNRYTLSRVPEVFTKVRCALRPSISKKQNPYLSPTRPRYVLSLRGVPSNSPAGDKAPGTPSRVINQLSQ